MTHKPFLEGKTINLRPLVASDVEGGYIDWFNDIDVCKYNAHHVFPYNRELALKYIAGVQDSEKDVVLAIIMKDEAQKHVGNISLQNINRVSRNAEYAIILGEKEYWGKGIAKEASLLIIKHGFEALNLHRIYCGTSVKNIAMQKLALYLNMKEEGRRKEALYKDGEYVDIVEYGLLRQDFKSE